MFNIDDGSAAGATAASVSGSAATSASASASGSLPCPEGARAATRRCEAQDPGGALLGR